MARSKNHTRRTNECAAATAVATAACGSGSRSVRSANKNRAPTHARASAGPTAVPRPLRNTTNRNGGNVWKLVTSDGETRTVPTHGGFSINDGQSLLNAAIDGLGIACLPDFLTATAMQKGLVADALPSLAENTQPVFAIYPPGRFTQPKVRAYIDFLVRELNAGLPLAN